MYAVLMLIAEPAVADEMETRVIRNIFLWNNKSDKIFQNLKTR